MKQIKYLQGLIFIALMGLVFSVSSCSDDDDAPVPTDNSINGKIAADASFSLLSKAISKATLGSTLGGAGSFTVFAPDNSAFAAAGITEATINSLSQADVAKLLLYHTLTSKVVAAAAPAGPNAKVLTANSPADSVFITRNASGVYVNGVKVTLADIDASNGVIHKMGRVLQPASGNIVETAIAAGLDSLVKAVTRATTGPGGDPTLAPTLSTATLTVFAPTNQAFTNLLAALSLTNINDIPMPTLLAVLRYHVVGARAFSSDLANGSLAMLAGGNCTINLSNGAGGGPTITGNSNGGNGSNIVSTDIACRNGVVHLIDRVLLP